jgi:hypothetical protein
MTKEEYMSIALGLAREACTVGEVRWGASSQTPTGR